jgi:glycosyltransferase involved in cell wall biosynthesis
MELPRALGNALGGLRYRNRLLLVGDRAGWIVDQVAEDLRAAVPAGLRPVIVTGGWRRARRCVVHLLSRAWAWADGVLDGVDASNQLIGLWWHGRVDSPDPAIQAGLGRLRRLHPRFARVQVTSSTARRTMLGLGVPAEKIVVLPEGVSLARFRPAHSEAERRAIRQRLGIPEDVVAVGCFQKDGDGWGDGATPKWIKGPDVLAQVLARLREKYPVHAVIPGPARGYLRRRLHESGVPYTAPGFVAADNVADWHRALDLYLSPSRDEGGPAGLLESMASGVPVVSTRTGMPEDIIESGVNGFVVDVGDLEGLAASAAALIERDELRRRCADRGLETIRQFDWPVLGRRYAAELYWPLGVDTPS